MSSPHDIFQAFSKLDFKTLKKVMKDTYGLDSTKEAYILKNMDIILVPESFITIKLIIYNLSDQIRFKLYEKYFKVTTLSLCHNKSLDAFSFMSVLLYYDSIKELHDRLSDLIDISLEETVYVFITSSSDGYFTHLISKVNEYLEDYKW